MEEADAARPHRFDKFALREAGAKMANLDGGVADTRRGEMHLHFDQSHLIRHPSPQKKPIISNTIPKQPVLSPKIQAIFKLSLSIEMLSTPYATVIFCVLVSSNHVTLWIWERP